MKTYSFVYAIIKLVERIQRVSLAQHGRPLLSLFVRPGGAKARSKAAACPADSSERPAAVAKASSARSSSPQTIHRLLGWRLGGGRPWRPTQSVTVPEGYCRTK